MKDPARNWLEAACRGDEAAAAHFIDEFHTRIYAFLRRLTGSETAAAELTQQAFCRAWSAASRFQGRATVSSWLHGIAYRAFVDWLRANRRFEWREDAWWELIPDHESRPDCDAAAHDAAAAVYRAVDELERGLRDTVHLHYYQGLTLEETADALGIATSTVKYRLRDALGILQRKLESLEEAPRIPAELRPTRPVQQESPQSSASLDPS